MTAAQTVRPAVTATRSSRAAVDGAVRVAAGGLLWLGLLLPTYWWVADGALRVGFAGGAAVLAIGQLTGLVASVLLLAQVVLMARIPLLERAFGQDDLARKHRIVGFTSFNLMLAHILTVTVGYAAGDVLAGPATFWNLTVDYPGMLLALAGTVCLVMVVVTSIKLARRRLRYESWHLLHLYAYLGVGLALPHQLWTGQQFLGSTGRTVFWWTAWAAAAGAVLVWRLGLPAYRSLRHGLRVTSVVREADGVVSVYVTGRDLGALRVEAGQFFSWRFLAGRGWSRAHPYSLSAAPDGRSLRITVKDLGDGSRDVVRLRPGTRVVVEGPYGRLSPRARRGRKVLLIGSGVGITPIRALAEGLDHAPGEAMVLHRYRDHPLFVHEFAALARERGLQVFHLPGRRRAPGSWLGDGVGPVSDLHALLSWVPDVAQRDVYVCGPDAWAESVRRTTQAAGVPPEQLHLETFAW
jgi:predicted ferric reductase